ncbi:glycine zipper domain-containing protein [Nocardia sp. NPDC050175]|uniref:glycine zipper domain-containing protein n=1 Tax=Nocardia sp. NPDC050175 TaxID=3364317 RepID=UPI003790C4C7
MGGIVAALTIPLSVNSDMQGDDPDSLQRALAREVPAAGVGILASAAVGAAVGSIVPVAGTAVGFVAGAVAGGLAALAMSKGMNHLLPRFAAGGLAAGSGNSTSDDILAWISNGEYVVNAASTSLALPLLQALNAGWVPSPEFLQGMLSGSGSPKTLAGSPGVRAVQAQSLELRGVAPSSEDDDSLLMAALLGAQLGELAASILDPQQPAKTLELPGPAIAQPADSSVPQFKPVQVNPDTVLSSGLGGALSGAQSGAAQHGLVGALTGGISGAASSIGGTIGSAAGTVIGAALGPVGAVIGPVIGQFLGSMAGSKMSEVVTKPIEYAANTAKEVIGSGFGLVDLAKGPGGHTARGDIYNFNGMDPKSAAIAVERVQRRRTLAQQRGGGLGR